MHSKGAKLNAFEIYQPKKKYEEILSRNQWENRNQQQKLFSDGPISYYVQSAFSCLQHCRICICVLVCNANWKCKSESVCVCVSVLIIYKQSVLPLPSSSSTFLFRAFLFLQILFVLLVPVVRSCTLQYSQNIIVSMNLWC